jgi:hypothetical protein
MPPQAGWQQLCLHRNKESHAQLTWGASDFPHVFTFPVMRQGHYRPAPWSVVWSPDSPLMPLRPVVDAQDKSLASTARPDLLSSVQYIARRADRDGLSGIGR